MSDLTVHIQISNLQDAQYAFLFHERVTALNGLSFLVVLIQQSKRIGHTNTKNSNRQSQGQIH